MCKKTITIKENGLLVLKGKTNNFATNENVGSKDSVIVSEARPEVDEYEIGQESDNPPVGGNYCHVNESSSFNSSEIGAVNYSWDFDEDEYQEWLGEMGYENTQESLMEYINDNVEFELEYLDNETYHTCGSDYVDYNTLEDMFGEKIQAEILTNCKNDGSGSFEITNLYGDDDVDVTNQDSVNAIAMKLLRHGNYFKNCRGFILTNGVVVYTELEHNEICRIPNINNKFDFIRMGNIRVLPQSIDIGAEPTSEQRDVLRKVIASYSDEELYLDIYQGKSSVGVQYMHPNWRFVMGEIDRFYSEGIKPQGNKFYESKKIQITENESDKLSDYDKSILYLKISKEQLTKKMAEISNRYGCDRKFFISNAKQGVIQVDPNDMQKFKAFGDERRNIDEKIKKIQEIIKRKEQEKKYLEDLESRKKQLEKQDIISLAVEQYGLTYNINEAGYILPDGSLLKFGKDGTRDEDHRGIQGVYFQNNIPIWSDEYRYNYVVDFMNHGAIRCDVFTGILDMTQEPTNEQYFVLKKFVSEAEDIDIDFTDNKGNTIHSASYTNANPQLVVADIYRFYNEGIKPQGNVQYEDKKVKSKTILVSENQLSKLKENLDFEVDSSEIDLSSFKKKSTLAPNIWDDNDTLNSKVRLRLLDIADDFWEFVNLSWVKPKGIILTGSICNFNWSHYSDIDLHLIVDFKEIDEKTEFVKDYLGAKKNEWNETHSGLKIYDFQIELYVQDVNDELDASGVYDLEENKWIIKPSQDSVKPIGLNKFAIKDKAAEIMTIIDDMYDVLHSTNDSHEIEVIGDDAKYLWSKLKDMRKHSLRKQGESGSGNIVWKYLRRKDYLDKLWRLSNIVYDRVNSISEGKNKNKPLLREYLEKNNNAPLYKYFKWVENASDEEKLQDLMYECPYVLEKYIKAMSNQNKEVFEPLRMEIARNNDIIYDEDLIERASKIINELGLYDAYEAFFRNTAHYYDWPSWLVMDFIRVVKNEWCIHFTSDSDSISKEGFTGGTNDMGRLGYTGAGQQKSSKGYDFAFLINDRNVDFNRYGDEAVIFRTSGVLVDHYGDQQRQVIFWGPNVKSFIPITQEDGDWVVYGQNGQVLIRRDKPSEIAEWATFNLPQYRKQIMTGKNGYIPKQTVYDTNGYRKRVPYPIYRNESIQKYLKLLKESTLNEEWVADGNAK